jgi:sugar phosphate isomerase/epimerase
MILGIGTFSYPWAIGVPGFERIAHPVGHFELLERAIRHGVGAVQYVDNLPLTALSEGELDRLIGRAKDAGVTIEVGMRGTLADGPEGVRAHLALVKRCGGSFLRVMIDTFEEQPDAATTVARLKPLVGEFAEAGVVLAIENFDRFPARQFAEFVGLLGSKGPDDSNAPVGICLDTVNNFGALEGPDVVVPPLAPLTVNLHVKDFVVERVPSRLGFVIEGRPAGQGRLDVEGLLPQLPACRSVTLELWTPPEESMEATCEKEAVWVEESLAYLKGVVPTT